MHRRFTAYRRNLSTRGTHTADQRNADHEPQFEGVIWTDGTVTLRWLTACRSTSVWNSLEEMLRIHGHPEYGTEIVFHDGPPAKEWVEQVDAFHREMRREFEALDNKSRC